MCEKWRYTQIFWDARIGRERQIRDTKLEDKLRELIVRTNDDFREVFSDLCE